MVANSKLSCKRESTFVQFVDVKNTFTFLFTTHFNVFSFFKNLNFKLECGPMPNVMAAPPNVGCTLCSTLQTLADAHYSIGV